MAAEPLKRVTSAAIPLLRDNVNTDAIIPSREMKSVSRVGLADGLFADWRYTAVGGREPAPGFPLNDPRFAGARILLAGANFGCGSSREHAAWALLEYGFRAIVAESFNPIFRANAVVNGIAPVQIGRAAIETICAVVSADPAGHPVTVDLEDMEVSAPACGAWTFGLNPEARAMLLEGLDAIDLTLHRRDEISAFRDADRTRRPWAYP